jgi:hypothetical protein
LGGNRCSG